MQEEQFRVTDLDLVLDHTSHRVTRGSRPPVDFGGNCQRWAVLTELAKRHPGYCSKERLTDAVWKKSDPAFQGIQPGTIHSTVHAVRQALRLLGIGVIHKKGLGYVLKEIAIARLTRGIHR